MATSNLHPPTNASNSSMRIGLLKPSTGISSPCLGLIDAVRVVHRQPKGHFTAPKKTARKSLSSWTHLYRAGRCGQAHLRRHSRKGLKLQGGAAWQVL